MRCLLCLVLLLLLVASTQAAEQLKCPEPVTHIAIPEGEYSPLPGTVFQLKDFSANMVSRGKSSPLCFLRTTEIQRGEVFVSSEGLSKMFARKVKQSDKDSISDVTIETQPDKVVLKGRVRKVISLPFTLEGPVTTDGRVLELRAKSIKAMGIPMKGLLDALGKRLGTLIQSESINGVAANGDTLIFQPEGISHVRGRITKVSVNEKGLYVEFAEPTATKTRKLQSKLLPKGRRS
jgi:hypothetical protein